MSNESKRASAQPEEPARLSRREFLSRLGLAASGLVAGLMGIPILGFLLAPLFRQETEVWREVGALDDFEIGETVVVTFLDPAPVSWAGVGARTAAWLRRLDETEFIAFSVHCTHLGCPVQWQREANLFFCPCHGGVFHGDGSVASGPVREPLANHPVRLRDGQVEIGTTPIPLAG